ncbi:MAG: MotA/TolQ/ExbB proton channel family protein [Planctomycetota bacterium]|nr:MAG: MotA/TolQ/ExbB proton channel family protein [Planctomycetota bacterium]
MMPRQSKLRGDTYVRPGRTPFGRTGVVTLVALAFLLVHAQGLGCRHAAAEPIQLPDASQTGVHTQESAATEPQTVDTSASAQSISTHSLWQVLRQGGFFMLPIAFCSLLLVTFTLERLAALRRGRVIPKAFVTRLLAQIAEDELDRDTVLELCEENGSPAARVLAAGARRWGRPAVEVEQAVLDEGERVCNELRRNLRVFHGVSTISPLLGLLGTVTGMIRAFNMVAQSDALGRPEMLASGISEALLTTAAGLCVAIPALGLYLFFTGKVDRLIIALDAMGQDLVQAVSEDDTASVATRSQRKAARNTVKLKKAA